MPAVVVGPTAALLCLAGLATAADGLPIAPPVATEPPHFDVATQLGALTHALVSLPIAAVLGAVLAFRPRRRGTPGREPAVIQTQIVLAVLGALIMLVVGASLARAFGIVGAAGLIRYRAKIADPKDAVVMLSTLGVGLASGVGLYLLAGFATVFLLGVLWLVESLEPTARQVFTLRIGGKEPTRLRPGVERVLRRNQIEYELRSASSEDLCYEVKVPVDRRIDRISDAITALDGGAEPAVQWEDKKAK
ncbi:MAG TPA: MgtC/SapB family protein [Candidatus Binatia bacterium]|nr:MgtC/SapB family protein [Candidatus Binatia bacterium]